MIKEVGQDIWTVDGPEVVFAGISMNTRMTVARQDDGRLWIHSPIELNEDVARFVGEVGPHVAVLVAPNKFHHMFIQPWREQYPDAAVFAHQDLRKKIAALADAQPLTDTAPSTYSSNVDQVLFSGNPMFREAVFFHRSSASLIFTDLVQNLAIDEAGWLPRLYAQLDGVAAPNGGVPRLYKWLTIDRRAARQALAKVREWAPKQVLFCHGDPIELDAEVLINREFSYLS